MKIEEAMGIVYGKGEMPEGVKPRVSSGLVCAEADLAWVLNSTLVKEKPWLHQMLLKLGAEVSCARRVVEGLESEEKR